jgi:hypothetical protein
MKAFQKRYIKLQTKTIKDKLENLYFMLHELEDYIIDEVE